MVNGAKASETSLLIQFQFHSHPAGEPLALEDTEETGLRQCYVTAKPDEYRWTRRRRIIGGTTSENLNGARCMYLVEANLLVDVDRVTHTKYKQAPLVRLLLRKDEYRSRERARGYVRLRL